MTTFLKFFVGENDEFLKFFVGEKWRNFGLMTKFFPCEIFPDKVLKQNKYRTDTCIVTWSMYCNIYNMYCNIYNMYDK